MPQESLVEYRIRMLEETIKELRTSIDSIKTDMVAIRGLMIEDRTKSAILIGGVPTALAIIISALGVWVQKPQ